MRKTSALLSTLLLLYQRVCAQQSDAPQSTTVIQLYDPVSGPLQASIVDAHNDTTTMRLLCPPDSTLAGCGDFTNNIYTFGPGILHIQASFADQYTYTEDCSTAPNTAVCRYSESANTAVISHTSTVTDFTTSLTFTAGPGNITTATVTIVSGIEKLPKTTTAAVVAPTVTSSTAQASSASPQPTETMSGDAVTRRLSRFGVFAPLCGAILIRVW